LTIGLDTSIVVRLLVGEPAEQATAAQRRLARAVDGGELVFVTDLALAEAYHALHCHYGVPKDAAQAMLRALVSSGVVELRPEGLEGAWGSSAVGLVDRLIHARHRAAGAITLTFDRRQAALEGAVLLS